jgi:transposase InsO family protein/transposase-like protein
MSKNRRTYSKEFKEEAIKLVEEEGLTCSKVEENLGIGKGTVSRWIREKLRLNKDAFCGSGNIRPSEKKYKDLQKELERVKRERDILKKAMAIFSKDQSIYGVKEMCQVLGVYRGNYYRWLNNPEGVRIKQDKKLKPEIKKIFNENRRVYGADRVAESLRKNGIPCGKTRAGRLMNEMNFKPKRRTKHKVTTLSNHSRPYSQNLLNQDFKAYRPHQIWASDIAYIKTYEGTLYLAVILDLYTRKIVGWSMSERLKDALVKDAFKSACKKYEPEAELIFHSDRGSQYCSYNFRKLLSFYKCRQSMSDPGNCYDNAISETFFKTLRAELTYHSKFETRGTARRELFDYIECFYNRIRLHSGIGYYSPHEFEENYFSEAA